MEKLQEERWSIKLHISIVISIIDCHVWMEISGYKKCIEWQWITFPIFSGMGNNNYVEVHRKMDSWIVVLIRISLRANVKLITSQHLLSWVGSRAWKNKMDKSGVIFQIIFNNKFSVSLFLGFINNFINVHIMAGTWMRNEHRTSTVYVDNNGVLFHLPEKAPAKLLE